MMLISEWQPAHKIAAFISMSIAVVGDSCQLYKNRHHDAVCRDSWDLVANLCQTAFGCEVVMEASLEDRQVLQAVYYTCTPAGIRSRRHIHIVHRPSSLVTT